MAEYTWWAERPNSAPITDDVTHGTEVTFFHTHSSPGLVHPTRSPVEGRLAFPTRKLGHQWMLLGLIHAAQRGWHADVPIHHRGPNERLGCSVASSKTNQSQCYWWVKDDDRGLSALTCVPAHYIICLKSDGSREQLDYIKATLSGDSWFYENWRQIFLNNLVPLQPESNNICALTRETHPKHGMRGIKMSLEILGVQWISL